MPSGRHSKRGSKRTSEWSSSVLGSHARRSGAKRERRNSVYAARRSTRRVEDRSAEITQMRPHATVVDSRTKPRSGVSPSREYMRRRKAFLAAAFVAVAVAIVALAFNLGSCVFRNTVSSNMAIDDPALSSALTAPEEGQASCTLLVGVNENDPTGSTASWLTLMRTSPDGGRVTLLDVPSNIVVTVEGESQMLRDVLPVHGPGALVSAVSGLLDTEVAHYLQIDEAGLAGVVDALGGVEVDVKQVVDDPRVSSTVIDPGTQTLDGQQAVAFVSASNYAQDGRAVRMGNQFDLFLAVAQKLLALDGVGFMQTADQVSTMIATDLDLDGLESLARAFRAADPVTCASVPGADHLSGEHTYFYPASSLEQVMELFNAGEDPVVTVDTSGIDKSKVTIEVLNGSGTNGLALQAAELLTSQGWTVQDTGNAESYVFDETLVVYRSQEDEAAAQAVVDSLGLGRAVYGSVYYSLTTDLQVNVGKDWITRA